MIVDLKKLETENVNEKTKNIDKLATKDIINLINDEDFFVAQAVKKESTNIAKAVDLIYDVFLQKGRLIYIGAGNSGRLGVLDACECPPTFGVDENQVIGILSGGYKATFRASEGAEDLKENAVKQLKEINFNRNDIIVGLSASGRTPYVKAALEYASILGSKTISISCVNNAEISKLAQIAIEVVTGAEVIAGSTRLKAGTAQKMVLNMISTTSMIKLGKVYGNYMVDVRANNNKLLERGKKIIMECTGVDRNVAQRYLNESDKNVKLAVFMILSGLTKDDAKKILNENQDTIYKALEYVNK